MVTTNNNRAAMPKRFIVVLGKDQQVARAPAIMRARTRTAVAEWANDPRAVLLFSGKQKVGGRHQPISEARVMQQMAIREFGVPPRSTAREARSTTTRENAAFVHRKLKPGDTVVKVVTSASHAARARKIFAKEFGRVVPFTPAPY